MEDGGRDCGNVYCRTRLRKGVLQGERIWKTGLGKWFLQNWEVDGTVERRITGRVELINETVERPTAGHAVKIGAYAMNRVAAGADLLTPWLCEPARRPDDRVEYCLECSSLPKCKHRVLVSPLQ